MEFLLGAYVLPRKPVPYGSITPIIYKNRPPLPAIHTFPIAAELKFFDVNEICRSLNLQNQNAMKCKILLLLGAIAIVPSVNAQKNKKSKTTKTTGYAITAVEKGARGWKEVRLVDLQTGEVLKQVYDSRQEVQPLNARTGKPIEIAETKKSTPVAANVTIVEKPRKVVDLDQELDPNRVVRKVVYIRKSPQVSMTEPFATNSAACALDERHDRLYYTPMGINQLRYIDLKSNKVYFFENEDFGKVKGMHDVNNQITRMVIASDDNGYALTNDARNLIRFTTGKKPAITELGSLTDDPSNTRSVHLSGNYGGDMIADHSGNLYLITAYRHIYQINIKSLVAVYKGSIKGLPQGFSTNGAMVEEGSKVILASSESTLGYFRLDLNTLQAEKMTDGSAVFNASDLANGNLAFSKKKKEKEETEQPAPATAKDEKDNTTARTESTGRTVLPGIAVYPNPVTEGIVKLTFSEQPAGRYRVQLLDITGRVIGTKEVNINGGAQVEEFRFPELSVKGNYLIRITNEASKINVTDKIVVQ
jgi:hypothetical protein